MAKFFDKDFLGMYLVKKIFMGADEAALTFVSQLCIEEAIGERICEQRPGIWEMQRKACEDILDQEYETMPSATDKLGYLRVNLLRRRIDRGENTSLKKKNPQAFLCISQIPGRCSQIRSPMASSIQSCETKEAPLHPRP